MQTGVLRRNIYLIIVIVFVSLWPLNTLVIETVEGTHWCPFPGTLQFTVSYTHSVSLTNVQDTYRVMGKGFYAIKEKWQSFLAGQPIDFQKIEGKYYVKEINVFLGREWRYWFIPVNDVTIKVKDKVIVSHLRKEGIVTFKIIKMPLIFTIFRRC